MVGLCFVHPTETFSQSKVKSFYKTNYNTNQTYKGTFEITTKVLFKNGRTAPMSNWRLPLSDDVKGIRLELGNVKWDPSISAKDREGLLVVIKKNEIKLRKKGAVKGKNPKKIKLSDRSPNKSVDFNINEEGQYFLLVYFSVKLPSESEFDLPDGNDSDIVEILVEKASDTKQNTDVAEVKTPGKGSTNPDSPSDPGNTVTKNQTEKGGTKQTGQDFLSFEDKKEDGSSSGGNTSNPVTTTTQSEDNESKDWQKLVEKGTYRVRDLKAFLRKYPSGSRASLARERLNERERSIWELCELGEKEQCERYLRYFPSGTYVENARTTLAELEEMDLLAEEEEADQSGDTSQMAEVIPPEPEKEKLAGVVSRIGDNYEIKIKGGSPPYKITYVKEGNPNKRIAGKDLKSDSTFLWFIDIPKKLSGKYLVEVDCADAEANTLKGIIEVPDKNGFRWIVLTALIILIVGGSLAYYFLWYKKMKEKKISFDDY